MAVLLSQDMLDLKVVELRDAVASLLVERAELRAVYPILALHLLDHEFRVGDDAQTPVPIDNGKVERGKKRGIFGKIIGVYPQIFAQFGQDPPCRVLDIHAEAGWARVAARPAIAVGDNSIEHRSTKAAIRGVGLRRHRLRLTCPRHAHQTWATTS